MRAIPFHEAVCLSSHTTRNPAGERSGIRHGKHDECSSAERPSMTMLVPTLHLLVAGLLMFIIFNERACAVKPFYRHFDDYLNTLAHKRPELEGDGGKNEHRFKHRSIESSGTSGSNRRHMSCCMLGEMAGDKGFHCFVDYYAARIVMRNRNRAHNRKLGFYGRYRSPNYGHHLMKTFERCVQGQSAIFHKCCHLATIERQEDVRFRVHTHNRIKGAPSNHTNVNINATNDANDTMIEQEIEDQVELQDLI
uniref:Uncharacterized protein n=1 Tax=Strigamia maritima TaxID=126957 RepID=T1J652_STRMM